MFSVAVCDSINPLSVADVCLVIIDFYEAVNAHSKDDFFTVEAVRAAAGSMLASHQVT